MSEEIGEIQERMSRLEAQLGYVAVEQICQKATIERHTATLETLNRQTLEQDYQTKRVMDRTDRHRKEMEQLKKLFQRLSINLSLLKYIGGVIVTLIIGYIFSLFFVK